MRYIEEGNDEKEMKARDGGGMYLTSGIKCNFSSAFQDT